MIGWKKLVFDDCLEEFLSVVNSICYCSTPVDNHVVSNCTYGIYLWNGLISTLTAYSCTSNIDVSYGIIYKKIMHYSAIGLQTNTTIYKKIMLHCYGCHHICLIFKDVRAIVSGIHFSIYYGARHSSASIVDKFNRNNSIFYHEH